MKRLGLLSLSLLGLFGLGCDRDDSAINKKIDEMNEKLDRLLAGGGGIGKGAARPGADMPQRPKPNPNDVYSVPVGDSPSLFGPKAAKVTIVEAFDFA